MLLRLLLQSVYGHMKIRSPGDLDFTTASAAAEGRGVDLILIVAASRRQEHGTAQDFLLLLLEQGWI